MEKCKSKKPAAPAGRKVIFEYKGETGCKVALAGSFNNWQLSKLMTDKKGDGVYTATLILVPGEYQYKFNVNGEWCLDAANSNLVPNEFGTLNNVLKVTPAKRK